MAQTQNLSTLNGLKKIYYALETKDDTDSTDEKSASITSSWFDAV